MFYFEKRHYVELSEELKAELSMSSGEIADGVIELSEGQFEVLFQYNFYSGKIQQWRLLMFCDGIRCSHDFNIIWIDEMV